MPIPWQLILGPSCKNDASDKLGAKLFVDATGSIGLESHHELADIMAFSSCKGLFGLTGASFVAHKSNLVSKQLDTFYFNLETQKQKKVTGPCHAIASLYGIINKHDIFKKRVINSKNAILEKIGDQDYLSLNFQYYFLNHKSNNQITNH